MPDSVLVADRGVSSVRVLRGCQALSVKAVSVHTSADADALHATLADESVLIGREASSYDDVVALVEAARQAGVDAVHPGGRELPGLEQAVLDAGLAWLGGPLHVPVGYAADPPLVEARASTELVTFATLPPRAVEVVTGLDLACASLVGEAEGVPRDGVAVSIELRADTSARVTRWQVPESDDVWVDAAFREGTTPVDPLLAVLTAWGPDRDAALDRLAQAWDEIVLEGPAVRRSAALERGDRHP